MSYLSNANKNKKLSNIEQKVLSEDKAIGISKKGLIGKNLILIALVIVIAIIPLIFVKNAEFGGVDGEAMAAIGVINPEYTPWFSSLFEPASGEIESLIFAIQAAIGAGVIFYYIGYNLGRKKAVQ